MIDAIRAHLDASLPRERWPAVHIAEDVTELGRLAGMIDSGSAIVMPFRERAGSQALATGGFRQRVEMQFAVGIVLRIYDQMMGAERATRFDTAKLELETALAGWEPLGACEECELVGGESSPVSTGVSIYVQTWATARFLTA